MYLFIKQVYKFSNFLYESFIISALYLFHEFTFIILGLKLSPSMGMGTNSASQPVYTPRGAIHVQASQIEQEIDELKTVLKVTRIVFLIKNVLEIP